MHSFLCSCPSSTAHGASSPTLPHPPLCSWGSFQSTRSTCGLLAHGSTLWTCGDTSKTMKTLQTWTKRSRWGGWGVGGGWQGWRHRVLRAGCRAALAAAGAAAVSWQDGERISCKLSPLCHTFWCPSQCSGRKNDTRRRASGWSRGKTRCAGLPARRQHQRCSAAASCPSSGHRLSGLCALCHPTWGAAQHAQQQHEQHAPCPSPALRGCCCRPCSCVTTQPRQPNRFRTTPWTSSMWMRGEAGWKVTPASTDSAWAQCMQGATRGMRHVPRVLLCLHTVCCRCRATLCCPCRATLCAALALPLCAGTTTAE